MIQLTTKETNKIDNIQIIMIILLYFKNAFK